MSLGFHWKNVQRYKATGTIPEVRFVQLSCSITSILTLLMKHLTTLNLQNQRFVLYKK